MDEKPFYEFKGLKRLLESMGYLVEKATGYHEVENVDVNLEDFHSKIDFTDDGIFLIDPKDGSRQQIFLYKREYYLTFNGERSLPRYHICKCATIDRYISQGTLKLEYRRANCEPVKVIDKSNFNREKLIRNLPLCKNCARKLLHLYDEDMSSKDFVQILKEAKGEDDEPENLEVDIFGYTKDWEHISTAYKESRNYTCERCGIHIDNAFDRQYIHTHHKDGNKLNNKTSNLECLCIRCHSQVNAVHRQNYAKGANKILLDQFNKEYPKY